MWGGDYYLYDIKSSGNSVKITSAIEIPVSGKSIINYNLEVDSIAQVFTTPETISGNGSIALPIGINNYAYPKYLNATFTHNAGVISAEESINNFIKESGNIEDRYSIDNDGWIILSNNERATILFNMNNSIEEDLSAIGIIGWKLVDTNYNVITSASNEYNGEIGQINLPISYTVDTSTQGTRFKFISNDEYSINSADIKLTVIQATSFGGFNLSGNFGIPYVTHNNTLSGNGTDSSPLGLLSDSYLIKTSADTLYQSIGQYLSANSLNNLSANWNSVSAKQDIGDYSYNSSVNPTIISYALNSAYINSGLNAYNNSLENSANWNIDSKYNFITNPINAGVIFDISATDNGDNTSAIQYNLNISGYVENAINEKITNVYVFKGSSTIENLPISANGGWVYNLSNSGIINSGTSYQEVVNIGDNVSWVRDLLYWDKLASTIIIPEYNISGNDWITPSKSELINNTYTFSVDTSTQFNNSANNWNDNFNNINSNSANWNNKLDKVSADSLYQPIGNYITNISGLVNEINVNQVSSSSTYEVGINDYIKTKLSTLITGPKIVRSFPLSTTEDRIIKIATVTDEDEDNKWHIDFKIHFKIAQTTISFMHDQFNTQNHFRFIYDDESCDDSWVYNQETGSAGLIRIIRVLENNISNYYLAAYKGNLSEEEIEIIDGHITGALAIFSTDSYALLSTITPMESFYLTHKVRRDNTMSGTGSYYDPFSVKPTQVISTDESIIVNSYSTNGITIHDLSVEKIIYHDNTLSGDGTSANPLKVIGGTSSGNYLYADSLDLLSGNWNNTYNSVSNNSGIWNDKLDKSSADTLYAPIGSYLSSININPILSGSGTILSPLGINESNLVHISGTETIFGGKGFAKGIVAFGQDTLPTNIGDYVAAYVHPTYGPRVLAYNGITYQDLCVGSSWLTPGKFSANFKSNGDVHFGYKINLGKYDAHPTSGALPSDMYYNNLDNTIYYYNGTSWIPWNGSASTNEINHVATGDSLGASDNISLQAGSSTQWSAHACIASPLGDLTCNSATSKLGFLASQVATGNYMIGIYKVEDDFNHSLLAATSVNAIPASPGWISAPVTNIVAKVPSDVLVMLVIFTDANGIALTGKSAANLNFQPYVAGIKTNLGILTEAPVTLTLESESTNRPFIYLTK